MVWNREKHLYIHQSGRVVAYLSSTLKIIDCFISLSAIDAKFNCVKQIIASIALTTVGGYFAIE